MKFFIEVRNEIGVFQGEPLNGTKEMYEGLLEKLSAFHLENGYEMYLSDGSYFIVGPEILRRSVILVVIIDDND